MKRKDCISKVMAGVLSLGTLAAVSVAFADTWRGTAPFCDGSCRSDEIEIKRSSSGNGSSCWSGSKVLCRKKDSEKLPTTATPPVQPPTAPPVMPPSICLVMPCVCTTGPGCF